MIEAVTFTRFKQFKSQRIPLQPQGISLLAGGNNSGKTSVLHGLAVWEFCRTVITAEKGEDAFLPSSSAQGLGLGDDEFSPINVPSLRHLWTNLASQKSTGDSDGYTLRIKAEWTVDGVAKELEFGLALANDRLFVKTTGSNLAKGDQIPRLAYLPPFAGITDREGRVPGAIRRRRVGEGLAGAVLRNLLLDLFTNNADQRRSLREGRTKIRNADLRKLRETDPWELLQQALRERFGAELAIAPFSEEYHSYIRAEIVKGTVKGYRLKRHPGFRNRDLMVEGSGLLQWLSVFALAVGPGINTLLLDEPDAHLHSSLQQDMVEALSALIEVSGQQILMATHSTQILKHSRPNQILELSSARSPRILSDEIQKVGLLAGLGSQYAPRIDALKERKHLLLVEGQFDERVLNTFAEILGREIPSKWVPWTNASGHKERKHVFLALKEEIPDLVALSLRDRDDEPLNTVGDMLADKTHDNYPHDFHAKKWRRRHIESYLLWPETIAGVSSLSLSEILDLLRNTFGIAIGDSFPDRDAPPALIEVRGKDVLAKVNADPLDVAREMPADKVPQDVIDLLDELDRLAT